MSDTVKGIWFETLVCGHYGKCEFYLKPPPFHPPGRTPILTVCPECGSPLKVETGRLVSELRIKEGFLGLKSKKRVIVGFELIEKSTD